jgi:putative SOS response-associated peptidase YedK
MCSHYQAIKARDRYFRKFGVYPPPHEYIEDMWPKYQGTFIRRAPEADSGDRAVPARAAEAGRWGLVPWNTTNATRQLKLSTFNARAESVADSSTFGGAWRRAQRCIIPADAIYEPDWRTGRHVPVRIARADTEPLAIAGLWDRWDSPAGPLLSYTMLTINADDHEFMCRFHRPGEEKRMVVVLREEDCEAWLAAPAHSATHFMRQCPPADLVGFEIPPSQLGLSFQ